MVGSSAQFRPHDAVAGIIAAAKAGLAKPIAAFLVPQADLSLRMLGEAGIAAFRTPESCADAIRAFLDWRAPREVPAAASLSYPLPARPDEADARGLFAAMGLDSGFAVMRTPGDAPEDMHFPVALKVMSPDLAHKTEVGGVVLNIADAAALRTEAAAMLSRVRERAPEASITGFLVQPMTKGLAEAILGFRRDPEIGPVVLVGAGGIMAELHRDTSLRCAPVDEATAREMIAEVKGLMPLVGLARAAARRCRCAGAGHRRRLPPGIAARGGGGGGQSADRRRAGRDGRGCLGGARLTFQRRRCGATLPPCPPMT